MAGRGAVFWTHPAELAFLIAVGAVIGIVDEIDGDDPRPRAVEDRHGQLHEQEVSSEFEPTSVEGMEQVEDGVVAGSIVILGAYLSNRGLIDAGEDDDGPDVARIEERASIPGRGSSPIAIAATPLTSHAERKPSDWGSSSTLTQPDIFSNQIGASAPPLNSIGNYRGYGGRPSRLPLSGIWC